MFMRKLALVIFMAAFLAASGLGQNKQGSLEQVLALLDKASTGFKAVQTEFQWDQYQKVVDEHDVQKGVMYFKRSGTNVDVAADIRTPAPGKKLLLKDGELQVYSRKTGQTTPYDTRKNRQNFEFARARFWRTRTGSEERLRRALHRRGDGGRQSHL